MISKVEKNIIDIVYDFVNKNPIYYREINIKNTLVVSHYLKLLTKRKARSLKAIIKYFLFSFLSIFKIRRKIKTQSNFSLNKKNQFKYTIVQGYSVENKRLFPILDETISHINDTNSVLIITDKTCVYNLYNDMGFHCIYMKIPRVTYHNNILFKGLGFQDKIRLAQACHIIDYSYNFLKELETEVLLTTQDFHVFEQCWVHTAKQFNIFSATHQHGLLSNRNSSLVRFMFSDNIFVWGEGTKKTLSKYINPDQILVSGTSKFNNLLQLCNSERSIICIAINPIDEKLNVIFLSEIFKQLRTDKTELPNEYSFLLKLHPSMPLEKWKIMIQSIAKSEGIKKQIAVEVINNEQILQKTKVLISYRSTISLEGFISRVSVIELLPSFNKDYKSALFENIPESIILAKNLSKELIKRITNKSYYDSLILKQDKLIKYEIESFNPNKNKLDLIDEIVFQRRNTKSN